MCEWLPVNREGLAGTRPRRLHLFHAFASDSRRRLRRSVWGDGSWPTGRASRASVLRHRSSGVAWKAGTRGSRLMVDRDGVVGSRRDALDPGRRDHPSVDRAQPYRDTDPRVIGSNHGLRIPPRAGGPRRAVTRGLESDDDAHRGGRLHARPRPGRDRPAAARQQLRCLKPRTLPLMAPFYVKGGVLRPPARVVTMVVAGPGSDCSEGPASGYEPAALESGVAPTCPPGPVSSAS
jgi:hypothetical protein